MKYRDLISCIQKAGNGGISIDDLKAHFGEDCKDDISRLIEAGLNLQEIKKEGKGRGTRYYDVNVEIVKITVDGPERCSGNMVGGIDVSGCQTVKQKIQTILNSQTPLTGMVELGYRESVLEHETGKELIDFIKDGSRFVDIGMMHDKGKNVVYKKSERVRGNKLSIYRKDNKWILEKTFHDCLERPEITEYSKYEELEKVLRTLVK